MSLDQTFRPVDAMDLRKNFGAILDQVELQHQRFIIQRRGKDKAVLVPLSDSDSINARVALGKLDQTYQALERIKGTVTDPALSDASTTIDEHLYGK